MGKRSFSVGDGGAGAFCVLYPVQQALTKLRFDAVSYTHLDVYKRQTEDDVKAHIENVKSIVEQYKDIVVG